ncbi:MAG: hypothetical protein NZ930_07975 [Candidatus Bipolaricaulota bacterium]|nr:hypothetical protein [Candidatus Bipolaricaulota bacterium]MDW8031784.1 hypothetical protein [Candidatus Bipolaricaulota bacterium]
MRSAALAVGVLLLGAVYGCAPAVVQEAQLDQPFTLFVRQKAQIGDLQIRFVGVPEDARCPIDVSCIWAGNAKIVLGVSLKESPEETMLTLNSALDPREALFAGYRIRFVSLKPERFSERTINPAEYRVTLIVSRAS